MKNFLTVIFILTVLSLIGNAQQPGGSPQRRSGLDSMDLLSVPRTGPATGSAIIVDSQTFEVLQPLVVLSRTLETDYRDAVIDRRRDVDRNQFLELLGRKTTAIYRSMLLLAKMDNILQEVCDLLTRDHEMVADIGRVAAVLRYGDRNTFKKQVDALVEKFNVPASESRLDGTTVSGTELLIAAMFRRLNSDFARIKSER